MWKTKSAIEWGSLDPALRRFDGDVFDAREWIGVGAFAAEEFVRDSMLGRFSSCDHSLPDPKPDSTTESRNFTKADGSTKENLLCGVHRIRFARSTDEASAQTGLLCGEIFLFEDAAVVEFVAGGDVGQGADADSRSCWRCRGASRLLVEVAEQRQRGAADGDVVFDDFGERTRGERAVANVVVLLEAFDGRAVSAGDAQSAVGEDAFGVADVAEDFFYGPFAGSVAEVALGFVAAGEQDQRLAALGLERAEDVVAGDREI